MIPTEMGFPRIRCPFGCFHDKDYSIVYWGSGVPMLPEITEYSGSLTRKPAKRVPSFLKRPR